MGTDTPLAVLSDKPQPLYQLLQTTFCPGHQSPIDCIREELITSAETTIGSERNLLKPEPESCRLIELKTPILTNEEFAKLKHVDCPGFKSITLPILYKLAEGAAGLEMALAELFAKASQAIRDGTNILILTDRGIGSGQCGRPRAAGIAGLHHHLIREGTRTRVGLVLESGEPRESIISRS